MSINSRLAALEHAALPPTIERHFNTCDDQTFVEIAICPVDYRAGIIGADGTWPPGTPTLTRAELAAIAGPVNIIRWVTISP